MKETNIELLKASDLRLMQKEWRSNHYDSQLLEIMTKLKSAISSYHDSIYVGYIFEHNKNILVGLGYYIKRVQTGIQEWQYEISW